MIYGGNYAKETYGGFNQGVFRIFKSIATIFLRSVYGVTKTINTLYGTIQKLSTNYGTIKALKNNKQP